MLVADLVRTLRPAWDTRAITAAIAEVRHRSLAEIVFAAVRIAENPANQTPKALTFEGEHWKPMTASHVPPSPRDREALLEAIADCELCDLHGRLDNGWLCLHNPEAAERARRGAELARQALFAVRNEQ